MRSRSRIFAVALAAVVGAGVLGLVPAAANHNADDHSKNIRQIGRKRIKIAKGIFAQGSDLAFQKRLVIAGSYEGTGIFKRLRRKPGVKQIGFHQCPASQGDVSVWGKLMFVSVDNASSNSRRTNVCNNTKANGPGATTHATSTELEGVRIVNIKRPRHPRQVGFVQTDCGSHTHTLVPDGRNLYIYVESYPLGAPTPTCNGGSHRKISIIKVNKRNPAKSDVVGTHDVTPAIGCHDVTVFPKLNLAAAACISENQLWNISNPKAPKILAHIPLPEGMQIAHSSAFTWDGKVAIFSDEYGGAAGGGGCTESEDDPVGAMYFYDITDRKNPVLKGHHSLGRVPTFDSEEEAQYFRCTIHNYNILPMRNRKKYIVVSSAYMGGMTVVDFSDPTNPTEIGHYMPQKGGIAPDMWSAYWYNGRIYTNEHSSLKGVSVFKKKRTGIRRVRFFKGRLNPQTQLTRFR